MAFLDDLIGTGSGITEHIADTPGLAREMRYSPSLAQRQDMQNYLGPLAAQDFAADARRTGDVGGMVAAVGSPLYALIKAASPELASKLFGTGGAVPSEASLEQVLRAWRGLGGR
jgi:hypothetical protein